MLQIIRTMIVDDEERIRRGIERLVRSCGEHWEIVGTFGDGQSALSYMHEIKGEVDLVISDVRMPEMDGLTFIQEARRNYDFSPLLISGYDDFEYVRRALRDGAVDYILKPLDREQLRTRLQEIEAIVNKKRQDSYRNNDMQRKAMEWKRTRQSRILSEVTGTELDLSRLGYWVDEFPAGAYLIMNVSLDALPVKARDYTQQDWKAYSYAMENIINELVTQRVYATVQQQWWWRSDLDYGVLLYAEQAEKYTSFYEEADQLASQICASIQRFTPFTVSVSQSDVIEDLYLLREAKQQAHSLLNYRLIVGGNRVFGNRSVHGADRVAAMKIDSRLLRIIQVLIGNIKQEATNEAEQQLNAWFEHLESMESPAGIQWHLQYLLIQIHSVWMESCEGGSGAISLEEMLKTVKRASKLSQVKEDFKKIVADIIEQVRLSRQHQHVEPVDQAKQWIMKHLGEEMTIKLIADHVYMNPTYFCKYFKLQTGETVLDYVTRMKMDRARQLLRAGPNVRLQDVCEQVGYQDVKYFSRLFKQWVGQTPSQYRESMNE